MIDLTQRREGAEVAKPAKRSSAVVDFHGKRRRKLCDNQVVLHQEFLRRMSMSRQPEPRSREIESQFETDIPLPFLHTEYEWSTVMAI